MTDLNKLGTVLTVVFAVCLLALAVEVTYVLCRRRRFLLQRRGDIEFSEEASFYNPSSPSKELLYFFCWKNQTTRVEPSDSSASVAERGTAPPLPPPPSCPEAERDEELIVKLQQQYGLYGPSRFLFTIKEEEKEGLSSTENDGVSANKVNEKEMVIMRSSSGGSTFNSEEVMEVDDVTPFWTPCASPVYYTPTPSPSRDGNLSGELGAEDAVALRPA